MRVLGRTSDYGAVSPITHRCRRTSSRFLPTDEDFAVRLLLCENHADVPGETVLAAFLEARTLSRGLLLDHPALRRLGLARLADSSDPCARCLVVLDPDASPELLGRLSHDPHPAVRASTADDQRLSPARVLELLDDLATTECAAASPHLPIHIMERILADAGTLDLARRRRESGRTASRNAG